MSPTPTHPEVWMIGHSNHSLERFAELLRQHRIEAVMDVRSQPRSRWPHFDGQALRKHLRALEIVYDHAPLLGGKPASPPEALAKEIERRTLQLKAYRTAVMCSEGNHEECHRHYWLTPAFLEAGWDVWQIRTTGEIVQDLGPSAATLRKMAKYLPAPPEPTLF